MNVEQTESILFKTKLQTCSMCSTFSVLLIDKGDNKIGDKRKKKKKSILNCLFSPVSSFYYMSLNFSFLS